MERQPLTSQMTPTEERKHPHDIGAQHPSPSAPPVSVDDEEALYRQHPPGGCPLRSGSCSRGVGGDPLYSTLRETSCIHGPSTHLQHLPDNSMSGYGRIACRMDSGSSTHSGSPPIPIVGNGLSGGGNNVNTDCSQGLCVNCSSGMYAPPPYEESLGHRVMPE